MAKDTRGLPENEQVKKGIQNLQKKSDEAAAAQAKDMSNEQIEAANASRMKDLPTSSTPKDDKALPDPLTPKPTIEEITPGQEARRAAGNVGTSIPPKTTPLDFGRLPSRPEGGSKPAEVNVTDRPDVAINLIDRLKSGMGLPGEEAGHLDRAVSLHERDRQVAIRTNKTVNGVQPNDPKATHMTVFGGHHHRLAKVMHTFGISDEDVYKSAASAAGQRLETHIHGLHKIAQEHEDSKRQITHSPKEGDLWEHPSTKELIPVAANHPDMPMAFTRTKGKVARVTRGAGGEEVIQRSHEGWDSMKVAGGKTVYRQYSAPKGIDLVDHLRVQMLSEHGPSTSSRKKGADIATQIADAVSGKVPAGMKQIGKRKVAVTETTGIVGETQPSGSRKYRKTTKTKEGTAPLLVPRAKRGRQAGEPPAPPKANRNQMLVGRGEIKDPNQQQIPFFEGAPVKPGNIIEEAAYKYPKRVNPNRGQQFAAIDTTDMTGAEEVRALRSKGALESQQNLSESRSVELRPGGKRQAKKDRAKPVQMSLFPSIKTPKESRKTSFYMAGEVQPISEASKELQSKATTLFGGRDVADAEVTGSRADKKATNEVNKLV